MKERTPVWLSWSGGKDCAMVLERLLADEEVEVQGLFSTYTEGARLVPIHDVSIDALEAQAVACGLEFRSIAMPPMASNEEYETALCTFFAEVIGDGVSFLAYGDLFLGDIRAFREELLGRYGLRALFPLWKEDSRALAEHFVQGGFEATIVAVNLLRLSSSHIGETYSLEWLETLPKGVDPCGENGEFHTFVENAPYFSEPVRLANFRS